MMLERALLNGLLIFAIGAASSWAQQRFRGTPPGLTAKGGTTRFRRAIQAITRRLRPHDLGPAMLAHRYHLLPESTYYEEGLYERDCRRGNAAAGTIFGARAGSAQPQAAGKVARCHGRRSVGWIASGRLPARINPMLSAFTRMGQREKFRRGAFATGSPRRHFVVTPAILTMAPYAVHTTATGILTNLIDKE